MATIQENLQIIADSIANIKQAIIDKGGEITGDITTYSIAIDSLPNEGGETMPTNLVTSSVANADNAKIYEYLSRLSLDGNSFIDSNTNLSITLNSAGIFLYAQSGIQLTFTNSGVIYVHSGSMP